MLIADTMSTKSVVSVRRNFTLRRPEHSMSLPRLQHADPQKEPFEPVTPGKVGMYVCGPTVYKPSHIGHMVGPVIFDTDQALPGLPRATR